MRSFIWITCKALCYHGGLFVRRQSIYFSFYSNLLLLAPFPSAGGMTLSPPFVLCSALSPAGVIAAGTADGRLFIGFGGEKRPSGGSSGNKKKRAKKWNGLDEEAELIEKFAEGPVVAV